MKFIKLTIMVFACAYLWGCASGAKMENMVFHGDQNEYVDEIKQNMSLGEVSGGKKTNPAWTSEIDNESFSGAVKESLKSQGLYSDNGNYSLKVQMLEVDQPMFGMSFEVTTHVQYILTDVRNGKVVLDEVVVAPYTATMSDAFLGATRLRLANEGAAKKNIEGLPEKLSELDIKASQVWLKN